ncbi:TPA: ABC transporter substrate-binding protein [Mannheimia haemolytica]|nr:ABC transporter substrate-binding protein [Mannheimia haemolytica]HDU8512705.1 ABC transporter substrate-binding protein [Mannheimia haemolytica]HDU8738891.1 ABC transporter substrate-binding protein [Mannheimia haemolytica]HDU8800276.1 ABC transporter substrate-binding protein [Mannheimia haemolytica]HDU8803076.1 ABC transporter substrate-binding protein [Mannheimia haemolytica]
MDQQRRDFMKLLSLFSLAGSLPLIQACEQVQKNAENRPLVIGYLPITDATPLLVAHAKGLFEKHGVQVEKPVMFRSWAQLVEAFLSGNVNVVHLLSPMSLWAKYGANAPVKAVMWNHLAGSALTVRPEINSIAELSGKTVAIPFWYSIHNIVLQRLLRENGLKITEKEPNSGEVLRFSGDVWKDHACCLTLMHEYDIQHRPDWVQKVVNALTEAQVYTLENRAETAKLLARGSGYTPHDQKVLEKVLAPTQAQWDKYIETGAIQNPQWHQQRIGFQPYPFDSYMEELVKMLKQTHIAGNNAFLQQLDPVEAAKAINEPTFVRKAIEQGGWVETFNLQAGWTRTEQISV